MNRDIPVQVQQVDKAFRVDGRKVVALEGVSLHADAHEFVSLIGPSGCGKSTLLNILCGLMEPDRGAVTLHGTHGQSRLGRTGYMPQRDLLLPWRTVLENITLGIEAQVRERLKWSRRDRALDRECLTDARRDAREMLPLFGLDGFEDSYPGALSGGMRQRAALMRTFMCKRDILLLDEPFGALDALTRMTMRLWLLGVWEGFRQTVLFVTHDVDEAIVLSDRVYVFSPRPGRIVREFAVDLPRPRQALAQPSSGSSESGKAADGLLFDPYFVALRQEILTTLIAA